LINSNFIFYERGKVLRKGDIKMIKKLLEKGFSKSAVARKLGISRETVRRYANAPDDYVPKIDRKPVINSVDPYLPYIATILETARDEGVEIPTTVIYDEIVKLGYDDSLRWLQTIMRRYELRKRTKEDEPLIRFETKAGAQMQMDWVEFPKDNLSAFVATMGYSRASYVEYVDNEKVETLLACHMNAFEYFGGVPMECLYDNMKTVIIKRNGYGRGKHKFNPLFEDFAKHCGFNIKVCKPYRAKTKGKVERFNHYLRYNFHNGLKVKLSIKNYNINIDNANAEVLKWLDDTANQRIHKTTLQIPSELLVQEQPHLLPVPKPYGGIHPKVITKSVSKKGSYFKKTIDMDSIYIPSRDIQSYDDLIPIALYVVPSLSMATGGVAWS
jgi:transposase